MKKFLPLLFLLIFLLKPTEVIAASCVTPPENASPDELKKIEEECLRLIDESHKIADSLGQQIMTMDNQIKVAIIRISQTEEKIKTSKKEIEVLSGKISRLDDSLNYLSKILLSRVSETYKSGNYGILETLFSSRSLSDFVSRYRYLQVIQAHDKQLLISMEQTKTNYDEQKQLKEKIQAELEKLQQQLLAQRKQLDSQISDRKKLLEDTKGKEVIYQKLLSMARAELAAISGILEGKGNEVEVKKVSAGERIASLIEGGSCNSSGTHLHFIVNKGSETQNPFQYLKSVDYRNCSGSSCDNGGDNFNPSGNWEWPLSPKITLTQGYGNTWAVAHTWVGRIYKFHNGIDIQGQSSEIKASKNGTLFRGAFVGNCILRYVKVRHDEDNIDTYYLHVNY